MKLYHYIISLPLVFASYQGIVHAFEPVPIDEFFKKFPEEQGEPQDYKASKPPSPESERPFGVGVPIEDVLPKKQVGKKIDKTTPFVPEDIKPVVSEYSAVEFLVLNRIELKTYKIMIDIGKTKDILGFKITAKSCKRREFPDNAHYTGVSFSVLQTVENKKTNHIQQKMTYDNIMYLELPGMNGFEDSVFDIHPIKCTKKILPVEISPEKDVKKENISDDAFNNDVKED